VNLVCAHKTKRYKFSLQKTWSLHQNLQLRRLLIMGTADNGGGFGWIFRTHLGGLLKMHSLR